MNTEEFDRKMHGEYTRAFGVTDIAQLTVAQANTLCDRLLRDVAVMDSQREQRKASGTADPAWLTRSGVAKHYRMALVRLIRDHHTALDIKSGFSDSRCRALYHACDGLVDIIQQLQDAGTALSPEDEKDLRAAEGLLDSVENDVQVASARAGVLRAEHEAVEQRLLHGVADELA